jgi:hypothetical protein
MLRARVLTGDMMSDRDAIDLLGMDCGPILEVIVWRLGFVERGILVADKDEVRLLGLSTALANADDLTDWLGLCNFPLRTVPCQMHIHIQAIRYLRFLTASLMRLGHPINFNRRCDDDIDDIDGCPWPWPKLNAFRPFMIARLTL